MKWRGVLLTKCTRWGHKNAPKFTTVSAMLRLGQKYSIGMLRDEAVSRLETYFPVKYDDFINYCTDMEPDYGPEDSFYQDTIRLKPQDAIAVIILARSHDLPQLLPTAFYIAAQLENKLLTHGFRDEDGMHWKLSPDDLLKTLDGRTALHELDLEFFSAEPVSDCKCPDDCSHAFDEYRKNESGRLGTFITPFFHPVVLGDVEVCEKCKDYFEEAHEKKCKDIWAKLPTLFHLEGLEWSAAQDEVVGEGGGGEGEGAGEVNQAG